MQTLLDRRIATRRGVMCAHREPAYQKQPWRSAGALGESERAQDGCILLPLYHQLSADEQKFIAAELRAVLSSAVAA
jgi:dTDP-4-amino-4,6-dideoxygalactose transaminase